MTGYKSKKAAAQAKVEGPIHVVCQCDKCKAQPAQEPVAWIYSPTGALFDICPNDADEGEFLPLYTTPPQRSWVGLTTDELNMIGDSMRTWNSWSITDVYTAIEAKLKDKNI